MTQGLWNRYRIKKVILHSNSYTERHRGSIWNVGLQKFKDLRNLINFLSKLEVLCSVVSIYLQYHEDSHAVDKLVEDLHPSNWHYITLHPETQGQIKMYLKQLLIK